MMKRILIANRGEIACRIARTCRRLGLEYVAVYTRADALSPHLEGAVESICIGEGPAAQSYLDGARVIAAAIQTRCDAVHPGYGFLSENSEFAKAVIAAGLVFVGPRPETIAALGDKARAKALMENAGVPVVPGGMGASEQPEQIEEMVRSVGLPALLKPSAGGGGKGMQVITALDGLREAVASAIRVARSSFGDGRLIVERYIEQPRHIEVQVFGDGHGNVVHFFERECSLQRRHQKVVEEAPALSLPDTVRQQLVEAAVRGARSLGYLNAGTFEFIVGRDHGFYFLEVNTRLQVEHPVTECITGLDLVEWQLRVAAGEALPLAQESIHCHGHAIECRIYAENPTLDFRPSPGRVLAVRWPSGIRVDAGIVEGGVVPPYYDPMVAKLVTHENSRAKALSRMQAALADTSLFGLTSNIGYLQRVLADAGVQAGAIHTRYLDEKASRMAPRANGAGAAALGAFIGTAAAAGAWSEMLPLNRGDLQPSAPWGMSSVWIDAESYACAWLRHSPQGCRVVVNDAVFDFGALRCVGGVYQVQTERQGVWRAVAAEGCWELQIQGDRFTVELAHQRNFASEDKKPVAVAPMSGTLSALLVQPGQQVQAGEVLAVVEAMKMEHQVLAGQSGEVGHIRFAVGDSVKQGDLIVEVAASD
jgi:propionyl-CoA carboxylase alpha chain/3-methylcrotonyl-CoA carboxylase alpha subunit